MTEQDRAAAWAVVRSDWDEGDDALEILDVLAERIAAAIAAARAEEREQAAQVADQCAADWREAYPRGKVAHHIVSTGAGAIAMKIRALK